MHKSPSESKRGLSSARISIQARAADNRFIRIKNAAFYDLFLIMYLQVV